MREIIALLFMLHWLIIGGYTQGYSSSDNINFAKEESIGWDYFEILAEDTVSYDLKMIYDRRENPQGYYTQLLTPVCETGVCKLVAISVYWDLSGNYLGYNLPPDRILTKLDHQPFTREDYDKLDHILNDKYWSLASYHINDLIVDSTKALIDEEIDAYSGATAKFVNPEDNIEGALYTIYTLWDFIHDKHKTDYFVAHTIQLIKAGKVSLISLLESDNLNCQKLAVKVLRSAKTVDNQYLDPLLQVIMKSDQYLAYDVLQLIDATHSELQLKLWHMYQQVEIPKKRDILQKLAENESSEALLLKISRYLSDLQHYPEARLLVKLLEKHQPLPENVRQMIKNNSFKSKNIEEATVSLIN